VIGRVEPLAGSLPSCYKINLAHLLMISHEEKRRVKKSPNHAISWTFGWSSAEVITAPKGRCEVGGVPSRLTKRNAFKRFLKLHKNNPERKEDSASMTYQEAKQLSSDFVVSVFPVASVRCCPLTVSNTSFSHFSGR